MYYLNIAADSGLKKSEKSAIYGRRTVCMNAKINVFGHFFFQRSGSEKSHTTKYIFIALFFQLFEFTVAVGFTIYYIRTAYQIVNKIHLT